MKIGITERGDAGLDKSWITKTIPYHEGWDTWDGLILITKSPQLIHCLPDNAILHCTITGYGGTILEPGVRPIDITIDAYLKWIKQIGPERCVLRIDPIILTEKGIATALQVFSYAKGRTRISFIDNYPHVASRFRKAGLPALKTNGLHYDLDQRKKASALFPGAEICGEPGLPCTGCVSARDIKAFNLTMPEQINIGKQRPACACLTAKTELLNNKKPCAHGCLYCYWKNQ